MAAVKGWTEPVEYADEGISGTKDESGRPGLARLMDDVRAGKISAVIVLDLSRLGRRTGLVLDLVEELSRHNVSLVSCKESIDTTTSSGKFFLTVIAALAELERNQVSERTIAAMNELGRTKGDKGGRLPFGYFRSGERIEVDEQQSVTVCLIFYLRDQGYSLRDICSDLEGTVTPRGGVRWHPTAVRQILMNEAAYRGGRMGESSLFWPAILTSSRKRAA
jgi:DNA invertase Pin-like site-specific DNA recombinase